MNLNDHLDWLRNRQSHDEQALSDRDSAAIAAQAGSTPVLLVLTDGKGVQVTDASGRSYIDFYGNNCHHVGHAHPEVVAAVARQMERLCFVSRGQTSPATIALAERLQSVHPVPGSKVMFSPAGSTAVEIALLAAKAATGRYKTISFFGAYHGRSAGALAVGGRRRDKPARIGPLVPGALHVPPFWPKAGRSPAAAAQQSLVAIGNLLREEGDIAALIAEPVRSGPTGPHVAPDWYWPEVRRLCDAYGAILIFDEVPAGLGKTGHLFADGLTSVRADITVLGKALGGGVVPLAATLISPALDTAQDLNLGYYTHERQPVSAAAGAAVLSLIVDGDLPGHVQRSAPAIAARLEALATRHPMIKRTRQQGFLFALDIADPATGQDDSVRADRLYREVIDLGLLPLPVTETCLSFSAPLVTTETEFEAAFDRLNHALTVASAH